MQAIIQSLELARICSLNEIEKDPSNSSVCNSKLFGDILAKMEVHPKEVSEEKKNPEGDINIIENMCALMSSVLNWMLPQDCILTLPDSNSECITNMMVSSNAMQRNIISTSDDIKTVRLKSPVDPLVVLSEPISWDQGNPFLLGQCIADKIEYWLSAKELSPQMLTIQFNLGISGHMTVRTERSPNGLMIYLATDTGEGYQLGENALSELQWILSKNGVTVKQMAIVILPFAENDQNVSIVSQEVHPTIDKSSFISPEIKTAMTMKQNLLNENISQSHDETIQRISEEDNSGLNCIKASFKQYIQTHPKQQDEYRIFIKTEPLQRKFSDSVNWETLRKPEQEVVFNVKNNDSVAPIVSDVNDLGQKMVDSMRRYFPENLQSILNVNKQFAESFSRISVEGFTNKTPILPKERLLFELEPKGLGRIVVEMGYAQDHLTARIIASTPEAYRLIENGLPQLQRTLEQNGIDFAKLALSVEQGLDQGHSFNGFDNNSFYERHTARYLDNESSFPINSEMLYIPGELWDTWNSDGLLNQYI